MLCVVGTEMGALAGLYWTVHDWNWPTLSGGRRQGQDVKALIMISPPMGFKGVSANPPLANDAIRKQLAVQILYGKTGKPAAAARRMHSTLGRETGDAAGYDLRSFDTSLQGTALFTEKQLNVSGFIASFIKKHVVDKEAAMPWKAREASATAEIPKRAKSRTALRSRAYDRDPPHANDRAVNPVRSGEPTENRYALGLRRLSGTPRGAVLTGEPLRPIVAKEPRGEAVKTAAAVA